MPVNEQLLAEHQSFRDEAKGYTESFVELHAGGARTLGVVSEPIGPSRELGWLICHSFGNEQIDLYHTEVAMARGLAAAGFRTIRFHCQGYGDAEDIDTPPTPSSHVRDTLDVLEQFRARWGVQDVGLVGARFGGMVAALVAQQEEISRLAMFSPVVDGGRYVTELLRAQIIGQLIQAEGGTQEELRAEMERTGWVNVQGWKLHRQAVEELESSKLSALSRTARHVLIVQVSRSDQPQAALGRLAERLRTLGASVEVRIEADPGAPHFGYEHFQPMGPVGANWLGDSLAGLNVKLPALMVEWASGPE